MREILFRAKQTNSNNWRYGDLMQSKVYDKYFYRIFEDDGEYRSNYAVNGDTIGQFTGIHDKKYAEIFEGDILKFEWRNGKQYIGKVVWDEEYACFDIVPHVKDISTYFGVMGSKDFEVIGNKFDNPELLEA